MAETSPASERDEILSSFSSRASSENDLLIRDGSSDASEPGVSPVPTSKAKQCFGAVTIFFTSFFVVVATVLGTGILALPVKVGDTGFAPFLVTFLVCVVAQALIIIYMVELLQRTQAIQQSKELSYVNPKVKLAELEREWSESEKEEDTRLQISSVGGNQKKKKNALLSKGPDLHTMGKYFLNRFFQIVFDLAVILHFISILITYSLAGPTAYAQLFGIREYFSYLISPFILILTLVVILGFKIISPVISFATLIKGSLLVVMIGLVGILGFTVDEEWKDSWQYVGRPFLIGTVALGGAMNTLPMIYSRMKPTKFNLHVFRFAAVLGICVCATLNIIWVLFILKIVPQTSTDVNEPTLSKASKEGSIATVPLIEIINKEFPEYKWLGFLVQIFITLSITVSYITVSSGLKHMLDGYVKTFQESAAREGSFVNRFVTKTKRFLRKPSLILQILLYLVCFAIVLIVAQFNPKQFFIVMEVFTSAALNLESGFFVAYMLWTSRRGIYKTLDIPLPLPNWMVHTLWFVSAYFLFAIIYDIIYSPLHLFIPNLPF